MRIGILLSLAALAACGGAQPSTGSDGETDVAEIVETTPLTAGSETTDAELEAAAEATRAQLEALGEEFSIVELVARTQSAFDADADGAEFELIAIDPSGEVRVNEVFILQETDPFESELLAAESGPGYTMHPFTLNPADADRMLEVRQTLADMRAAAPGQNDVSLNAAVTGCLVDGFEVPDALFLTFYMRIQPSGDFFPFVIEQVVPTDDSALAEAFWTPCEENSDP